MLHAARVGGPRISLVRCVIVFNSVVFSLLLPAFVGPRESKNEHYVPIYIGPRM